MLQVSTLIFTNEAKSNKPLCREAISFVRTFSTWVNKHYPPAFMSPLSHLWHDVLLGRDSLLAHHGRPRGLCPRDGGHDPRHEGLSCPPPRLLVAGLGPRVWDHVLGPGLCLPLVTPWRKWQWYFLVIIFVLLSPAAATSACLGALPRLAFLSSSLCFFVLLSWVTTIGVSSASVNHKFL